MSSAVPSFDKKRQDYLDLIKKQSTINRVYAEANAARLARQGDDEAPSMLIPQQTLEEEAADVTARRQEAIMEARKIIRPEVALEFVSNLDDEGVLLFLQVFPDFSKEVQRFDRRRIDVTFLSNLFDRYLDKFKKTKGIDIPTQSGDSVKIELYDPGKAKTIEERMATVGVPKEEAHAFTKSLSMEEQELIDDDFIDMLGRREFDFKATPLRAIFRGYIRQPSTMAKRVADKVQELEDNRGRNEARFDAFMDEDRREMQLLQAREDDIQLEQRRVEDERTAAREVVARIDKEIEDYRTRFQPEYTKLKADLTDIGRSQADVGGEVLRLRALVTEERGKVTPRKKGKKPATNPKLQKAEKDLKDATDLMDALEQQSDRVNRRMREIIDDYTALRDQRSIAQDELEQFQREAARLQDDRDQILTTLDQRQDRRRGLLRGREEPLPGAGAEEEKVGDPMDTRFGFGLRVPRRPRTTTFAPFGKHLIHVPLLQDGILSIRFPSKASHPKLPKTKISDKLKDALLKALQKGSVEVSMVRGLNQTDLRMMAKICDLAHVSHPIFLEEDQAEVDRFELLRGQVRAGNDNPTIIKELKQLVLRFLQQGRLGKAEVNQVLLELATLDT